MLPQFFLTPSFFLLPIFTEIVISVVSCLLRGLPFLPFWIDIFYGWSLTLKDMGGGLIQSIAQEIACHFSQEHTMVTKFLEFIHKHFMYKVVELFFYYLDRFSRNSAKTEPRQRFFGIENHKIDFFSIFS